VTAPRFAAALNAQIGSEFAAHQQYVAVAVHFDALTMPQMASFFLQPRPA
jgi:ferritin